MAEALDLTQAATTIGISKPGVLDAVKKGRLKRRDDKMFDAADVNAYAANRREPRGGETRRRPRVKPLSPPAAPLNEASVDGEAARRARAALEATMGPGRLYIDRAHAELARDSFQARLKELDFQERSGRLLDADRVTRSISSATAKLRSRLLAIPAERAPAIARMKSPVEVQDALQAIITKALEDLAADFEKGL